jgi:pentatricopeptide repeat protein
MYAKCGELAKAELVLSQLPVRDTVSWNALISGHARQEHGTEILQFFSQMQREGLSPDVVTFICILKACGIVRDGDKGNQIHNEIINAQILEKSVSLGSALVDMYAKCSMLEKAYKVLEELPVRDTVLWNTLIAGYALHERGHEALNCYVHMQRESLSPDEITFASLLKACGRIGAIDKGRQIHNEIAGAGLLQDNVMLGTALVDMYAKCGALVQAQKVLFRLPFQDTISWNALITGYSREGEFHDVLRCFRQMQKDGLIPNEVTFLCVLNACARTGKLDEAKMHYETMRTNYGITPKLEHHACMVVVFGCLGQFDKALSVIKAMPSLDDPSLWLALLNACKKWGNVEVGKLAFDQAIQLEKNLSAAYVLMANMCAAPGTKDSVKLVKMG